MGSHTSLSIPFHFTSFISERDPTDERDRWVRSWERRDCSHPFIPPTFISHSLHSFGWVIERYGPAVNTHMMPGMKRNIGMAAEKGISWTAVNRRWVLAPSLSLTSFVHSFHLTNPPFASLSFLFSVGSYGRLSRNPFISDHRKETQHEWPKGAKGKIRNGKGGWAIR